MLSSDDPEAEFPTLVPPKSTTRVVAYNCCNEDLCNDQKSVAASATAAQVALVAAFKSSMASSTMEDSAKPESSVSFPVTNSTNSTTVSDMMAFVKSETSTSVPVIGSTDSNTADKEKEITTTKSSVNTSDHNTTTIATTDDVKEIITTENYNIASDHNNSTTIAATLENETITTTENFNIASDNNNSTSNATETNVKELNITQSSVNVSDLSSTTNATTGNVKEVSTTVRLETSALHSNINSESKVENTTVFVVSPSFNLTEFNSTSSTEHNKENATKVITAERLIGDPTTVTVANSTEVPDKEEISTTPIFETNLTVSSTNLSTESSTEVDLNVNVTEVLLTLSALNSTISNMVETTVSENISTTAATNDENIQTTPVYSLNVDNGNGATPIKAPITRRHDRGQDEFKAIASALHRDTPYGLQPDESQAADAFWARQRHIKNSMRYEYIRQPIDDLDSTNEIKNEKKKQAKAPGHASNNWIRMMDLMVGAGAIGVAIFVFIGLTKFLENRNTQHVNMDVDLTDLTNVTGADNHSLNDTVDTKFGSFTMPK